MKVVSLALAIATFGLSSMIVQNAYANGSSYLHHGALRYYGGHAPVRTFYGYVPGQTTTFYHGYVPGFVGQTTVGSDVYYNGYAPYPYSRSRWWQRPWPSAPAAWW